MKLVDTRVDYVVAPVIQVIPQDNHIILSPPFPKNTTSLINAHPQVSRAIDWDKANNQPGILTITYKDDPQPVVSRLRDILETAGYEAEVQGLPEEKSLEITIIPPPNKNQDRLFQIGQDIQAKLNIIAQSSRAIAVSWWEIGKCYAEAQQVETDNGRFLCWVENNTGHSKSTVYRLIDIYKKYSYQQIAGMGDVSQAVLLALSDAPAEAKDEAVALLENGQKLTKDEAESLKLKYEFFSTLPADLQQAFRQNFNGVTKQHIEALYPLQGLEFNGLSRKVNFDLLFDTPHPEALYARMVKEGLEVRQVESVVNKILVAVNTSDEDVDCSDFDDGDFDKLDAKGGVLESTPTGVPNWRWQVVNGVSVAVNSVTGMVLPEDEFEERKEQLIAEAEERTAKRKRRNAQSGSHIPKEPPPDPVVGSTWASNTAQVAGAMSEQVDRVNARNEKRDQLIKRFVELANGASMNDLLVIESHLDDLEEDLADLKDGE